jgi:hypothetical protein
MNKEGALLPEEIIAGAKLKYPALEAAGVETANKYLTALGETLTKGVDVTIPVNADINLGDSNMRLPEFNIPGFATGSDNTPNAFIAGERGPELILNATGSKVFTAAETDALFNRLSELQFPMTADSLFEDIFNPGRIIQPLTDSNRGSGETRIEFSYTGPTITVEGGGQDKNELTNIIKRAVADSETEFLEKVRDMLSDMRDREARLTNA